MFSKKLLDIASEAEIALVADNALFGEGILHPAVMGGAADLQQVELLVLGDHLRHLHHFFVHILDFFF